MLLRMEDYLTQAPDQERDLTKAVNYITNVGVRIMK